MGLAGGDEVKRLLLPLLLAGAAVAAPVARDEESLARELVRRGVVCKVYGHSWEYGVDEGDLRPVELAMTRKCRLCGRSEQKREEWK